MEQAIKMSKRKIQLILFILIGILGCQEVEQKKAEALHIDSEIEKVELFGKGIISTHLYERDIAISPNGDELIYTLGDYKQQKRCLVQIRKSDGKWSEATILNISGVYQDIEPFYAKDGQRLYFASNRPMEKGSERKDYNIWYSERKGTKWGQAKAMNEKINTEKDEFYPSLSKNGNLYFTSTREGGIGKEDIFVSKRTQGEYKEVELLDSTVNTRHYEFNSYINPEENLLIFSSFGRADGYGGGDLYYSKKGENGEWSVAKNMGKEINSDKLDYCPFIDERRNIFYFTSERMVENLDNIRTIEELKTFSNKTQNGMGDIYRISLDELELN